MDPLDQQLNQRLVQSLQAWHVRLRAGPGREDVLHPALSLERLQRLQRVLFVPDLLQLIPCQIGRDGVDRPISRALL